MKTRFHPQDSTEDAGRTPFRGTLRVLTGLVMLCVSGAAVAQAAAPPKDDAADAKQVKAIFEKNCYSCHTTRMKGGLRLDSREAMLDGGSSGPGIVPGDPDKGMVMRAIRYKDDSLQMPPKGPLPAEDVAAVERWIRAGATDLQAAAGATGSPSEPGGTEAAGPPSASVPVAPRTAAEAATAEPSGSRTAAGRPVGRRSDASVAIPPATLSAEAASAQEQFFETKVRPVLVSRCFACHTAQAAGGLRLDTRDGVLKGGRDGAVVDPAHPENSLLLKAIHYSMPTLQMPPTGQIDNAEVAALEQWVRDGMAWPARTPVVQTAAVTDKDRTFWSYQKPVKPPIPEVKSKWAYNDIDRFLLAEMNEKQVRPVRDADRRTMIRRVTYDLTGLPPTPAEMAGYLADRSPDAYAKLVERLLASKAYGERWGRIWLDVVRYSDTSGDGADYPVPDIYKYRDYVVDSFAEDKPYDRFIREQIAGDLLPAKTEPEHWRNQIATGYLANASHTEDPISDAVDNIGYAFLGTSVACARCHDHKFDPLPTADYYGMYGVLASSHFSTTGWEEVRYQRGLIYRDPNVVKSQAYLDFETQLKPVADSIAAVNTLPFFDDVLPALQARRMALFQNQPKFEAAYGVAEGTPHNERIQHLGDKKNLGEEVPRHFLQVLGKADLPAGTKGSGRLEMANWIASAENPVTARVMVNRLWQGHFGRGIVPTPNDFGKRGLPPSNQPLLDFLATSFVEEGWSVKAMHRMILLSHAYQLASDETPANMAVDPDNVLLWRHTRSRMDAEEIRDTMLATSGLLDTSPAGPQPFPPEAEWNYSGHAPFSAVYETNRRTLYVMAQRTRRHPYLGLFDGANPAATVAQRESSVTPLQALYFMNAAFPKQCAQTLARTLEGAHVSEAEEIRRAFTTLYGRAATKMEIDHASEFVEQVTAIYAAHAASGSDGKPSLPAPAAHEKALGNLLQALYASNEFMYLD